jgi:hypothetical protein
MFSRFYVVLERAPTWPNQLVNRTASGGRPSAAAGAAGYLKR